MRIHIYPLTCDVCGERGMATPDAAAAAWRPGTTISHTDPRVCAYNLRRQRLKAERNRLTPALTMPGHE